MNALYPLYSSPSHVAKANMFFLKAIFLFFPPQTWQLLVCYLCCQYMKNVLLFFYVKVENEVRI